MGYPCGWFGDCSFNRFGFKAWGQTYAETDADERVKPGFHPNAIACVGKQPIMVATASTEHPIGCCLQPIGCSVEAVATMIGCLPTQAIAFGWNRALLRRLSNYTTYAWSMSLL